MSKTFLSVAAYETLKTMYAQRNGKKKKTECTSDPYLAMIHFIIFRFIAKITTTIIWLKKLWSLINGDDCVLWFGSRFASAQEQKYTFGCLLFYFIVDFLSWPGSLFLLASVQIQYVFSGNNNNIILLPLYLCANRITETAHASHRNAMASKPTNQSCR